MVIDCGGEFVPLFLAVDDLSQLIGISLKQISNQTIVEFLLNPLELCGLLLSSQRLMRLVKLEVLAELLEEFEHILTCLILHGALEERLKHAVVNLYISRVTSHEQEPLGILFEALTPF